MRLSVYLACSLDGFIATTGDRLEWLESLARADEDYGYEAFLTGVDGLAMGRRTYDHIAGHDPLPFGERPVFVFTRVAPPDRAGVTSWLVSPPEALTAWQSMGLTRVYVDGGALISSFLAEGLVDDLTITVVPVLLGSGRRLFHPGGRHTALTLTGVRSWPSGLAQLSYARS